MLEIIPLILGPVQTNAYLVADTGTKVAVVIDPAWDGDFIYAKAKKRGWRIAHLWITHAHFDHLGGAAALAEACQPHPLLALHGEDYPLWRMQGAAGLFGLHIDPGPEPAFYLEHGQTLHLGSFTFEVRHAPGHTRGHVLFYCAQAGVAFCGDVIFRGGIGRTDLPGGDYDTLMASIRSQVMTLPGETRLLSGHGPETTVKAEKSSNPFLK